MLTSVLRGAAVLGVACGLAAAPAADAAMTVRIGAPQLIARVAVSVPVTASCTPFDPAFTRFSDFATVSVQQASGRDIAFGSGSVSGSVSGGSSLLFACDGSEQTVTVSVPANTSGPPFHGGKAVVTATATASAGQPCFPGSTGCFTNIVSQSARTGAVEAHL